MTATDVLYQVNLRDKFKILHDVKEFYLVCTPSRRNSAGDRAGAYFDRLHATNSPGNTNKYKFVHNHKNKKYGECIQVIFTLSVSWQRPRNRFSHIYFASADRV